MATLDEITKEKQRLGEALSRVDAQREKLVSELSELETVERVLARYSKGTQPRKTSSAKMPTRGAKAAAPARLRGRRRGATAKSAGGSRNSSSLNDQVLALATGKTQQEIAAACKGARPNHVGAAIARHKRHCKQIRTVCSASAMLASWKRQRRVAARSDSAGAFGNTPESG